MSPTWTRCWVSRENETYRRVLQLLQEVYRRSLVLQLEFGEPWADTWNVMRYDVHPPGFAKAETVDEADLSFAAFSLEHAACSDGVLEVRLGEDVLLEWCMACAVMKIFRPGELWSSSVPRVKRRSCDWLW